MSKKSFISKYITNANEIIEKNDQDEAEKFVKQVISVFKSEIENIDANLYYTNNLKSYMKCDYIEDVKIIKSHLENYRANIKAGYIPFKENAHSVNVSNTINTNIETNIIIEFELVINNINKLSEDIISEEEKKELEDKIASLQMEISKSTKDKNKISQKLMNILKFTITKGPEVYIAISKFLSFISNEIAPYFN